MNGFKSFNQAKTDYDKLIAIENKMDTNLKNYTSLDSFELDRGKCFVVKGSKEDVLGNKVIIDDKVYLCIGIEHSKIQEFVILTKEVDESN